MVFQIDAGTVLVMKMFLTDQGFHCMILEKSRPKVFLLGRAEKQTKLNEMPMKLVKVGESVGK